MIVFALYTIVVFLIFCAGLYVGKKHGIPFLKKEREYAIGIYAGASPFHCTPAPSVQNPVLRARDVSDVPAEFVADPFMVNEDGRWHMFFEVMNRKRGKGDIGLASSDDGLRWTYEKIVLSEPFHLSYPYVFKWNGDYYMVPESCETYAVRLYRAVHFPDKWEYVKTLLTGNYFDSSLFQHDGRWWIFTSDRNDVLHLFFADDLHGAWQEHPLSPVVVQNSHHARSGGRVLASERGIFRFAQDCEPHYGMQVHAFEITELTPDRYSEKGVNGNPVLKPAGTGWNAERMHHLDVHQLDRDSWLACVDGVGGSWKFSLR